VSAGSTHLEDLDVGSLWSAIETAAELARLAIYVARIDPGPAELVYVSPRARAICGRSPIGLPPWAILREADRPVIQDAVARPAGAPPLAFAVTVLRPDGSEVPIELTATRVTARAAMYSFGYARDVSGEVAAEAALRASETRFRSLVEGAPDGVAIVARGVIVFINSTGAELIGAGTPDAAIGVRLDTFMPADDARLAGERIRALLGGGELTSNEYRTLAKPERTIEIKAIRCMWDDAPAVLAFARDVTERKALEQRLVDADRLASMGTLAAGVAHEINNPLTYALLGVQQIEHVLADPRVPAATAATIRDRLGEIAHAIDRIASITTGLRTFARASDDEPRPIELAGVLDRALRMVENDLRHRAQLARHVAAVPRVLGNASRLEQVIVNLLLNAIQALPTEGTHEIAVTLAPRGPDRVALAIRDTGQGIPSEVRHRMFEPFVTTRAVGQGMGLGLAVSRTIVDSLGGSIEVESAPGRGTTMTIVLPAHREAASDAPQAETSTTRARRSVLIVDDEPLVRTALARLLDGVHDVVAVASGEAALAALREQTFDVIVCDVMMPGMTGRELYKRIAATYPGVERRIVFTTGGTFAPELDTFLAALPNRCLGKPFDLAAIEAAIESACAAG
jgi:PAS domain S-box-containing protein